MFSSKNENVWGNGHLCEVSLSGPMVRSKFKKNKYNLAFKFSVVALNNVFQSFICTLQRSEGPLEHEEMLLQHAQKHVQRLLIHYGFWAMVSLCLHILIEKFNF